MWLPRIVHRPQLDVERDLVDRRVNPVMEAETQTTGSTLDLRLELKRRELGHRTGASVAQLDRRENARAPVLRLDHFEQRAVFSV